MLLNNSDEMMFYMNHELRRPVANLISVISLIRTEKIDQSDTRQHLDLLETTLRELDSAIVKCQRKFESTPD